MDAGADDKVRTLNMIARLVPGVEAMRQLGGTHGVSISNFCQGTWAFVLRAFTGSEDVCFGYLASGRDVSVDRIDEIFGPLISMLVLCQVQTPAWVVVPPPHSSCYRQ